MKDKILPPVKVKLPRSTLRFLKSWLAWVDAGAPHLKPYNQNNALCHAISCWNSSERKAALIGLDKAFTKAAETYDIDTNYPFGSRSYQARYLHHSMHLCPNRLAWVRAQLSQEGGTK